MEKTQKMTCEIQRERHIILDFGAQPLKRENMKVFQFEIMATTYH